MPNHLVKIIIDDDGEPKDDPPWCLIVDNAGGDVTCCEGEYFGLGESLCVYELKTTKRGGITCPQCLQNIKFYKTVKL